MKRKTIILIAILVLICLLPVFFFCGNPVSYALIHLRGNAYLDRTYPDLDLELTEVKWDFKNLGWRAYAASPTSRDTHFFVYVNGFGTVASDHYEAVTSGANTFARLHEEYQALAEPIFETLPWDCSISFAELTYLHGNAVGSYQLDYGIDASTLVLDADYDVRELGARHGRLYLDIHDQTVTPERAAELLLEVKSYFNAQGLPFYGINFHLCEPLNDQGQNVGAHIELYDFLAEDIHPENLVERVTNSWALTQGRRGVEDVQDFAPYYQLLSSQASQSRWRFLATGCVFDDPHELPLEYLFYLGLQQGSWDKVSAETEQALIESGFIREMDLQPMPRKELNLILYEHFDVTVEEIPMPEGWRYVEAEDLYCSNHNDAYFPSPITITAVEDTGPIVTIHYTTDGHFYNTKTGEFLENANLVMTLKRHDDGRLLVLSNTPE